VSILTVTEAWQGRRGSDNDTVTGEVHTRVFNVLTDATTDGPQAVLDAAGLPQILDQYVDQSGNFDATILCINRVAEQNQIDPRWWQVRCEYSADNVVNAVLEQPDVSWDTEYAPEAFLLCYGKDTATDPLNTADIVVTDPTLGGTVPAGRPTVPVKNSATDPYDPPPEDQRAIIKLVITRNERFRPLSNKLLYEQTINADAQFGFSTGQCYMQSIRGVLVNPTHDAQRYWRVTYEILIDVRGFSLKLLDAGFHHLNAGVRVPNIDPTTGQNYARPVPLDGSGGVLAAGGTYVYNRFAVRLAEVWAPLNLPDIP
jgi:hypothetical protein